MSNDESVTECPDFGAELSCTASKSASPTEDKRVVALAFDGLLHMKSESVTHVEEFGGGLADRVDPR